MQTFKGLVYWSGQGLAPDWVAAAAQILSPLAEAGATVQAMAGAPTQTLRIAFGHQGIEMQITEGRTQGIVREMPVAGAVVACLVALRRTPGGLDLVDDAQQDVPARIRQSGALYGADWVRVQRVAQALGLLASAEFSRAHAALLNQLI